MSGLGYLIASALSSAFTAIVGYVIYKRRAGVDIEAEKQRAEIRRDDLPLEALRRAVEQAYAEAAASRQQVQTLMSNHLEHDRQDRDRLIEVMARTEEAMRSIKDEIVAHRDEERDRTAIFHGRLNEIDKGIARIEGHRG